MGYRVGERPPSDDWVGQINKDIAARVQSGEGEHYALAAAELVAAGSVAPDTELKPNESVSRSYVFYVPAGAYDMLDVEAALPTASRPNAAEAEWTLTRDGSMNVKVFKLVDGKRSPLTQDADGGYSDKSLNLQSAESRRQLSLWNELPAQAGAKQPGPPANAASP